MSDNNKFSLRVGYVQLNIIKHALQHYIKRNAPQKEKDQEKRLLEKVKKEIGLAKQKYGISSPKTNKEVQAMFESHEVKTDEVIVINIPGISEWKLSELRYICKKHKVKGYTKMSREELIQEVEKILIKIKEDKEQQYNS